MASQPITFTAVRDRHEVALREAMNDLKAAIRYDAAALHSDITRIHQGVTGIAAILTDLASLDPETETP